MVTTDPIDEELGHGHGIAHPRLLRNQRPVVGLGNTSRHRLVAAVPVGLDLAHLLRRDERPPDPEEVLAGISAVTAEDVQRVAQDLLADDKLRLAVIGPFDDAERFEKLL